MNIGIIGAGFTGLASAYKFLSSGHSVTILEKDSRPGGLAVGFKKQNWDWTLEEHYHHWFANDSDVLSFAEEIKYPVITKRPKTSVYVKGSMYQLDSPAHVFSFPLLTPIEKIRMATTLGVLRYNPIWQPLEKFTADEVLSEFMGKKSYEMLWKPQLINKFGKYYKEISLAWFWARVYKRTSNLKYPEGGYLAFAEKLVGVIKEKGGDVYFNQEVNNIASKGKKVTISVGAKKTTFDAVLVTLPNFSFGKLAEKLTDSYRKRLTSFKGLGAVNMVLRLKKPFLSDGTYWLSICESGSPVMAVVEHTNFMDSAHFGGEHIVYLGNYVDSNDKLFSMKNEDIMKLFHPFLRKINPSYKKKT